jgi:hypothetical protein
MADIVRDLKLVREEIKKGNNKEAEEGLEIITENLEYTLENDEDANELLFSQIMLQITRVRTRLALKPSKALDKLNEVIQRFEKAKEQLEDADISTSEFKVEGTVGAENSDKAVIEAEDIGEPGEDTGFVEDEIERLQDQLQHLEERVRELEEDD